jgi:diguanylate cyclase (GGDEF)-like protein
MDRCLVETLAELMAANRVVLHRVVGDQGDEHWLTGIGVEAGVPTRQTDPSWMEVRELPPLASRPEWADCVRCGTEMSLPAVDLGLTATLTLFPMSADAGIVGVVEVLTQAPPEEDICAMARGVLGVFRNMLTLLDYSESDTLTGLLNRKSFDETFYKASALPLSPVSDEHAERRQAGPLRYWLGVIDIDHFKLVNDNHGHLIGDEVLLLLSRVMRQSFRFLDKLYRFGGEEFVVLMRCHSEGDALRALERLRNNVASHVFPRVEHVTVSVGFTDVRAGDTPPSAVERADLAVYHAKHHGRNQVRSHAALVREGELADTAQDSDIELF